MSLDDALFDGMFHGDGSARRPGTCFCGQDSETSDVEEAHCRRCLSHEPEAVFQPESPITSDLMQDAGVRLAAAAAPPPPPGAVTTPTALAAPLQTAAGTPSPRIPVVTVSPFVTAPSKSTAPPSGNRKMLTEAQAAKKKLTNRQSQQRRIGKMRALMHCRVRTRPIKRQFRGRKSRSVD